MNMNKVSFKLRLKLLSSLVLLLVFIVLIAFYQVRLLEQTQMNHKLLGELSKLEELSNVLPRRSQNYVNNAARDYESYRRDVKVFLVDILADVELVDRLVNDLTTDFSGSIAYALPVGLQQFFGDDAAVLEASAANAKSAWEGFESGFQEKLGDNPDEPRIEWGAEYIIEHKDDLKMAFHDMIEEYRAFLTQQSQLAESVLQSFLVAVSIYILLVILWVYLSVFRRIGKTVDACRQVANGNFGYKLSIDGNDEMAVLARSFNLLSNRSKLVLAMLSDLQQAKSKEEALQTIIQASGGYLPVAWAGLLEVNAQGFARLAAALPMQSFNHTDSGILSKEQAFQAKLADALVTKKAFSMDNLQEYAGSHQSEAFLRQLVKVTNIEAVLAIPLVSLNGWEGVLLFGTKQGEYRKDHSELLENLSSTIALAFEHV